MNVYDYAMQMEQDGENYYRRMADCSSSTGMKKIFFMLAIEEIKHYKALEQHKRQWGTMHLEPTKILGKVKTVFMEMNMNEQVLRFDGNHEIISILARIRDYEADCRNYYLEQSDQLDDMSRKIFLQLAGEEDKHLRIMKNIVELAAQPDPGRWLKPSLWRHLDEEGPLQSDRQGQPVKPEEGGEQVPAGPIPPGK